MVLNKKVKLEGTKREKIIKVLELSGWFSNRSVDISYVEEYYLLHKVPLVEGAKKLELSSHE